MSISKLSAVLVLLFVTNTFGQMSAEEVQARMDERERQRITAATQPGGIIEKLMKDNHDLQKENERLRQMLDAANDSSRKSQIILDNAKTRSENNDKAILTGVCPEVEVLYSCTDIDNNDFAGTFKRVVDMSSALKNEIDYFEKRHVLDDSTYKYLIDDINRLYGCYLEYQKMVDVTTTPGYPAAAEQNLLNQSLNSIKAEYNRFDTDYSKFCADNGIDKQAALQEKAKYMYHMAEDSKGNGNSSK